MRMRTITETIGIHKASDPGTGLTECAIRRMVNDRTIPHIRVGRKILLNYDAFVAYLSAPPQTQAADAVGAIRKVQ